MNIKEHYEKHLANFYSWMIGDFNLRSEEFKQFLLENHIEPVQNKVALDLGAGHGIQSVALKASGFEVIAVDFSQKLLDELKSHPKANSIKTVLVDIREVLKFKELSPELIVCAGDTITHLENWQELEKLISDIREVLVENGTMIFTFRDYSVAPQDDLSFIPVKSSDERILTCILDYREEKLKVTDLLYEKLNGKWIQKASSYEKLRIDPNHFSELLLINDLHISYNQIVNGILTFIAYK